MAAVTLQCPHEPIAQLPEHSRPVDFQSLRQIIASRRSTSFQPLSPILQMRFALYASKKKDRYLWPEIRPEGVSLFLSC